MVAQTDDPYGPPFGVNSGAKVRRIGHARQRRGDRL
jgi:hypothetical protein